MVKKAIKKIGKTIGNAGPVTLIWIAIIVGLLDGFSTTLAGAIPFLDTVSNIFWEVIETVLLIMAVFKL